MVYSIGNDSNRNVNHLNYQSQNIRNNPYYAQNIFQVIGPEGLIIYEVEISLDPLRIQLLGEKFVYLRSRRTRLIWDLNIRVLC